MKSLLVNNMSEALASMGVNLVANVPGDAATTNRLLMASLLQQRINMFASDVGIDFDTYRVWIEPGSRPTPICIVNPGDVVGLKMINHDEPQACTVFYSSDPNVAPAGDEGMAFTPVVVNAANHDIDFTEFGGPALTNAVASGTYTTGDSLAAAITAAILGAPGVVNTHAVTWHPSVLKFKWESDAGFTINWATGPNTLTSIGTTIGYDVTADDAVLGTGPFWVASDNILAPTILKGDQYLQGHPLWAGDIEKIVIYDSIYGVLPANHLYRVPLSIRRSRILTRQR